MSSFKFKQFVVEQDQCAMKVGTDGVLLGAWASVVENPDSILDIGAGTGLISLMLAQRSASQVIDAIEVDPSAYEQCVVNFENSSWGDRLFCYHASFDAFFEEMDEQYDLIVSNPPFFDVSISSLDSRVVARSKVLLSFELLLLGVDQLLSKTGLFSVVIPYQDEEGFVKIAVAYSLFVKRVTRVKGTLESKVKRSLIEFTRDADCLPVKDQLILEKERHVYTEDYFELVKDFYLKL